MRASRYAIGEQPVSDDADAKPPQLRMGSFFAQQVASTAGGPGQSVPTESTPEER